MFKAHKKSRKSRNDQPERCREQVKVPCPDCKGTGVMRLRVKAENGRWWKFKGSCSRCLGAGVLTGVQAKHLQQGKE